MGDAFRGLTIRLGADARPLQEALRAISSSANQAQAQLKKMSKALQVDPNNIKAMDARLEMAGDKALLMARAMQKTNVAMRQLAQESVKFSNKTELAGGNVKEVASSVRGVYAEVNRLRDGGKHINTELEHIYDNIKKMLSMQSLGKTKGVQGLKGATEIVQALQKAMGGVGPKAEQAEAAMERFVRRVYDLKKERIDELFGFDKATMDANKFAEVWKRLRADSADFNNDLKNIKKIEAFKAMEFELLSYNAKVKEAAQETARFRSELYSLGSSQSIANAVNDANRMDSVLDKVSASAREMAAAYEKIPNSSQAAVQKLTSMRLQADALNSKMESLENVMRRISKTSGFDEMAAKSKNVWANVERAEREYAKFEERIKNVDASIEQMQAELAEGLRLDSGRSAEDLAKLKERIESAKVALDKLRTAQMRADEAMRTAGAEKTYREAYEEVIKLRSAIESLNVASSGAERLGNAFRTIRTMGYGLYSTVTPALLMMGRYAISSAEEIDAAYRDMRKTVNGTEEQFQGLLDAAIEFSTTHVTTADTVLEIESLGGQLGIAAENLGAFSEVISNLDIATNIDSESLATYVGQLSNIMDDIKRTKDEPERYARSLTSFSDALVRLGNNSAAQESSIMKVMMRIASLGNISGFTTPQLLAISTAVAATGQGCEAAGTAISRTFSNIESAVGNGGKKLQEFSEVAGMSAEEFATTWEENPVRAFTAFIEGLKRIDETGGSVDNTLAELGINSVRQKQALEGLTNTLDVLHDALGMSQDAWDGMATVMGDGSIEQAGDAAREAQRKSEGFSGALQMMRNNAQALAQYLAQGAAPIISGMSDVFHGLTQAVSVMPDSMKTMIVVMGGAVAALGPLAVGVGAVGNAVFQLHDIVSAVAATNLFSRLSTGSSIATEAWKNFSETLPGVAERVEDVADVMAGLRYTAVSWAPPLAAAAAAMIYLGTSIADEAGKVNMHNSTISTLGSLMQDTGPKAGALADNIQQLGVAAQKAALDYDSLIKANAEMVRAIEERNVAAQDEINTLDSARVAIALYGNANRELSASEQGQLIAAIDLINEKCGTQYQILDKLTGKIGDEKGAYIDNIGAIDEYIAQKEKLIQINALEQDLADLQASKRETMASFYNSDNINEQTQLMREIDAINSQIDYTTKAIGTAQAAANGMNVTTGQSVALLSDWQGAFQGIFAKLGDNGPWKSWGESINDFAAALDSTGLSLETFSEMNMVDMGMLVSAWIESGGNINEALAAVGLAAKSAGEQVKEAFANTEGDMEQLQQRVDQLAGGDFDAFGQKLSEAGISFEQFANMGIQGFDSLLAAAGGDIEQIGAALDILNAYNLNPQTLQINEEGWFEVDGKLWQLDLDAGTVTDGERVMEITADASGAEEGAAEAGEAADEYADGEYEASLEADNSDAVESTEEAYDEGQDYANSNPTANINATDNATPVIDSVRNALRELDGQSATVTVYANREEHAAGGVFRVNAAGGVFSSVRNAVPRNASGAINGIVTRPTMTNVGLTGEAGWEAILHMRHAGGAIIPLSNRRYVRPFARAVAAEMPGGSTRNVVVNLTLDYKAGDDAAKLARGVANRLDAILSMEA